MLLSIIIVNYQSTADIQNCLRSASKFLTENQEIEWIVVDNDSKDGSDQMLSNEFPFIQYIQMGYNAGFARANNAGMKIAKGDQVLLLNPDTLIMAGSIEKCVERFVQSDHIACGVQLIHADGTPQFSGSKFVIGGLNHLMDLPYWGASLKFLASILQTAKPSIIKANKEQKVDWISGASPQIGEEHSLPRRRTPPASAPERRCGGAHARPQCPTLVPVVRRRAAGSCGSFCPKQNVYSSDRMSFALGA